MIVIVSLFYLVLYMIVIFSLVFFINSPFFAYAVDIFPWLCVYFELHASECVTFTQEERVATWLGWRDCFVT